MLPAPLRRIYSLFQESVEAWAEDYAPSMGAALAYYTLFSIAPLLLIVVGLAGLVFGPDAARGEIFGQLRGLMGDQGAAAIERLLAAADKPEGGVIATVTGSAMLLLGAMSVFGELQNALDRIWRAPARKQSAGWWNLLRSRLLSFGMILGVAFLLMVSLVVSAVLSALGRFWSPMFREWEAAAHLIDIGVSFGLVAVLFAMIYKLVTAGMFAAGKFLIGLYLGKSTVASAFGAAGSLVVMMVWVYYSAQIFLLGAEFTWVFAHTYGSRRGERRPRPEDSAPVVPVRPTGLAGDAR